MKVKIPYVVVTTVKDKAVYDILFMDDPARPKGCMSSCSVRGYKPLSSREGVFTTDSDMLEVSYERLRQMLVTFTGADLYSDLRGGEFIGGAAE